MDLKPEACGLTPTNRADDGLRTRDLQLGKLALYQLSYVRARGYFNMPDAAPSPP
jgi:hypothetical protein